MTGSSDSVFTVRQMHMVTGAGEGGSALRLLTWRRYFDGVSNGLVDSS